MARYHASADGVPRPCTAEQGACPLTEADGSATPHGDFATAGEAKAFAEAVNAKRFGGSFPAISPGPDKSKIPAMWNGKEAKPVPAEWAGTAISQMADWEDFEEFGSNYQDFKDSGGDHGDKPLLELTTTTQVFTDDGKLEHSSDNFERAVFVDPAQREANVRDLFGAQDADELASNTELVRQEWVSPHKRVTYQVNTYS